MQKKKPTPKQAAPPPPKEGDYIPSIARKAMTIGDNTKPELDRSMKMAQELAGAFMGGLKGMRPGSPGPLGGSLGPNRIPLGNQSEYEADAVQVVLRELEQIAPGFSDDVARFFNVRPRNAPKAGPIQATSDFVTDSIVPTTPQPGMSAAPDSFPEDSSIMKLIDYMSRYLFGPGGPSSIK